MQQWQKEKKGSKKLNLQHKLTQVMIDIAKKLTKCKTRIIKIN